MQQLAATITSFALVLISNASSGALKAAIVDRVCGLLADPRVIWLADNEACEILFDSALSAAELTRQAREIMGQTTIDAVCMPAVGRRKKLLVSDMDSTVIEQECIDELAMPSALGKKSER